MQRLRCHILIAIAMRAPPLYDEPVSPNPPPIPG